MGDDTDKDSTEKVRKISCEVKAVRGTWDLDMRSAYGDARMHCLFADYLDKITLQEKRHMRRKTL